MTKRDIPFTSRLSTPAAAALAMLQKGPAVREMSGSLRISAVKKPICQGALQVNLRAPARQSWPTSFWKVSSSSGQITGGSHQPKRFITVWEMAADLAESQRQERNFRAPLVSLPSGRLACTIMSGSFARWQGCTARGLACTIRVGLGSMRSSLACQSARICVSSFSRRSMR